MLAGRFFRGFPVAGYGVEIVCFEKAKPGTLTKA